MSASPKGNTADLTKRSDPDSYCPSGEGPAEKAPILPAAEKKGRDLEDARWKTDHRPWPLPETPWIMNQRWNDLLFAHWPVRPETVRGLIPSRLDLDRFDGSAWLTITPFRMTNVRPRGVPPVPGLSAFPETNFRTYVTTGGKPGVFFFSLDAGNRIAVAAARWFFHLPYFFARMRVETVARGAVYESRRTGGGPAGEFNASADAEAGDFQAAPGSLDHFLAERYCLYAADGNRILRAEIHHAPWPLSQARAEIRRNTLPASFGLTLDARPALTRFARRLDVRVWLPGRAE